MGSRPTGAHVSLLELSAAVDTSAPNLREVEDVDEDTAGPCCRSCRTALYYLRDHGDVFVDQ